MKKILVLFAVLLVAFMVFACGNNNTTTPAVTTPAATTPAKTTEATTVVTTEATTTVATTTPVKPGDVYVDLDFDAEEGTMVDKMGNVTLKPHNDKAFVDSVTITHNGIDKEGVPALTITETNSWVECTFTNLADYAQLNKFVEENKGWTVEAFYLNTDKKNIVGIVCVTEGNVQEYGKQGWGLADNAGNPYFIFGDGTNNWSTTGKAGVSSATEVCHVVAVYDATAKTNTVYLNGKAIKSVEAKGFAAAQATSKDGFVMGNGFFLGGDPTISTTAACDYPASDLTIVDVKIYAGALTAEKVAEAYKAATVDFAFETLEVGTKFVAYVPAGKTDTSINLASGKPVGALTAPEGVTLKDATLYLAEVKEGKIEVLKELGAAVAEKQMNAGFTNIKSSGSVLAYTSYLIRDTVSYPKGNSNMTMRTYKLNSFMDFAALNTAMGEDSTIGKFGTITFNAINEDSFSVYFDGDKENVDFITDCKVNFVYVNYDGSVLKAAKGNTWSPLAFNQMELIRHATDMAWGEEVGYSRKIWQKALDEYGAPFSVTTVDGKYNGTTQQNANTALWQNSLIPTQYASALTNYQTALKDTTEAKIKAEFDAAVKALEDAQKAFDDAVAANATVKALKDAIAPLEAAYNATRQPEYEARNAHEVAKAKDKNSQETKDLLVIRTEKENAMKAAKAPYDAAVKAYNDAVAADETLKALNAELVVKADDGFDSKADLHKVAKTAQDRVDNYKKWSALYDKFMAEYEKAANVALWTAEQAKNGDLKESPLYKAFKDIPEENRAYPTFTYYYDATTETYTIFVTSAMQTTVAERYNSSNARKTSSNYLDIIKEEAE